MTGPRAPSEEGWFSRQRVLTIILALATLLSLYVCYLIVEPFLQTVVLAMALAVATNKPYQWLVRMLNSDSAAAALGVVLVAIVIIAPLVTLLIVIAQQLTANLKDVQAGDLWMSLRRAIESVP